MEKKFVLIYFVVDIYSDAADDTKILRVIKLEHCYDLEEVQLRLFFLRLREGNYPNMRNIVSFFDFQLMSHESFVYHLFIVGFDAS